MKIYFCFIIIIYLNICIFDCSFVNQNNSSLNKIIEQFKNLLNIKECYNSSYDIKSNLKCIINSTNNIFNNSKINESIFNLDKLNYLRNLLQIKNNFTSKNYGNKNTEILNLFLNKDTKNNLKMRNLGINENEFFQNIISIIEIALNRLNLADKDLALYLFSIILIGFNIMMKTELSDNCSNLIEHTTDKIVQLLKNDNNLNNLEIIQNFDRIVMKLFGNKNEFLNYDSCFQNSVFFSESEELISTSNINATYIVSLIDDTEDKVRYKNTTFFEKYLFSFGSCLPYLSNVTVNDSIKGEHFHYCDNNDYIHIVKILLLTFNLDVKTMNITQFYLFHDTQNSRQETQIRDLIPLYLILIPLFIMIFLFLLKRIIIKNKKRGTINTKLNKNNMEIKEEEDDEDNENNDDLIQYKNKEETMKIVPNWYKLLKDIFSLSRNCKELFNFNLTNKDINNINGLKYIPGLLGISMILTVIGQTYFILFNLPIKQYGIWNFYYTIYYFAYAFLFIGLRYSPRIIFSCNGFTLSFKYLSFIAKKPRFYLLKFLLLQSYKYFLFILVILFGKFSMYHIEIFFSHTSPPWEFLARYVIAEPKTFLGILFNLTTFKISDIKFDHKRFSQNIFDFFWIALNEIFFFIFGTLLISLGYSLKFRIDYIIIVLFILIYIGKIIYYYYYFYNYDTIYTTLYYISFEYGKLMLNPLFNLPYFLIGMYFGLINYTIQSGIVEENKKKDYLRIYADKEIMNEEKKDNENHLKFNNSLKIKTKNNKNNVDNLFEDENEDDEDVNINENIELNIKRKHSSKSSDILINNSGKSSSESNSLSVEKKKKLNEKYENKQNNYENTEIKEMPYLKSSIAIVKYLRKPGKDLIHALILLFFLVIIIMFIVAHFCFISIYSRLNIEDKDKDEFTEKMSLESVISNPILNCIYLIDIELVVLFIHIGFFLFYMKGYEVINDFFSHHYWSFFNKIYFSFILVISPIILFNFYSSENVVKLNTYTIYLYSIINLCVITLSMILLYIYLELPLKKLFKYHIRKYEIVDENDDDDEENEEE